MAIKDAGPFIYMHSVPEKLDNELTGVYHQHFIARGISSLSYGGNNPRRGEKLPISVSAEESYAWKAKLPLSGRVRVNVSEEGISIYWDTPDNMSYSQANSELRIVLNDILREFDRLTRLKQTFK